MKKTSKKTITEKITYHLTDEIKYDITIVNGKEVNRDLRYYGKKLYDYELKPLYKEDLSVLKVWNPCWGKRGDGKNGYEWLQNKNLPEPEKIDISKIIFLQTSSHAFFTLDKKPIPVVCQGDFHEAHLDNFWYDLEKLHKHLDKHPNVVQCSAICNIPYYNVAERREKYLSVLVYPTQEILQLAYDKKSSDKSTIFYKPYDPKSIDFLNIKQFAIRNSY